MKNKKVLFLTQAAMIAALYVVLTFIANAFGLASGVIQVRLSEALTVLPVFTPAAVPGLYVGCFLANLLTGGCLLDILVGSLATLIGALGARALRKWKWLVPLPNIVSNMVIVPFVLIVGYGLADAWWYLVLTVGIGEIISCGILGMALLLMLKKYVTHLPNLH
ncbi:MAG: QueT transporter family protein [Lachnospiraceae bacterium]|nr:QueT transporter family protein [Lachnospiraceae bacterium]